MKTIVVTTLLGLGVFQVATSASTPRFTVRNNCGAGTTIIFAATTEDCQSAGNCGQLAEDRFRSGQNVAFYVAPAPFNKWANNNYGAATLAELAPGGDGNVWIDISRVSGFNYGVTIKDDAGAWRLTCNDVNCNDAYWLCENSFGNRLFSPNDQFRTTALTVTFCPTGEADTDHFAQVNQCGFNPRAQPAGSTAPYICQWNENWDLGQGGTCVTGHVSGNKCQGASPIPLNQCPTRSSLLGSSIKSSSSAKGLGSIDKVARRLLQG